MEEKATLIESLFEKAEAYAKTNVDLFKLKAIDKSADVVSTLVAKLVVVMVVALIVLMVNIALALWLGELLGKSYYGFIIIAFFYAIVAAVFHYYRESLVKFPVNDALIEQMLKEKLYEKANP